MSPITIKDIAIIIPARNEEGRIVTCLSALAGQCRARVTVILAVNNTSDRTIDTARDTAARHGLHLAVLERALSANQSVGTARRIGDDHALQNTPDLRYLLTTDANCIVAPDWIARNIANLKTVDAVCGKVDLTAGEADILESMAGIYRQLVQDIYARRSPGCADIGGIGGSPRKWAFPAQGGQGPGQNIEICRRQVRIITLCFVVQDIELLECPRPELCERQLVLGFHFSLLWLRGAEWLGGGHADRAEPAIQVRPRSAPAGQARGHLALRPILRFRSEDRRTGLLAGRAPRPRGWQGRARPRMTGPVRELR